MICLSVYIISLYSFVSLNTVISLPGVLGSAGGIIELGILKVCELVGEEEWVNR
jgi:hypothetical protein